MSAYRRRPSAGFVLLLGLHLGVGAVFFWASQTPALETVWRLDQELSLGERPPLDPTEVRVVQQALTRHPELGDFLVEDKHAGIFSANEDGRVTIAYAYLVRRTPDEATLRVTYAGTRPQGDVAVELRAGDQEHRGVVRRGQALDWTPPAGPLPQLISVRLSNPDKPDKKPQAVQLDWVAP